MEFTEYLSYFDGILQAEVKPQPYDEPDYFDYTKLNWSRTNRWLKKGVLNARLKEVIEAIAEPQEWILITEPWCGDAAHSVPFIVMLAELNPLIQLTIELRDQEPFRINEYLTNGGKSIPKLIIRNQEGKDIATWGPRPENAQAMYYKAQQDGLDFESFKEAIQKWYNLDKGESLQKELLALLG